MVRCANGTKSCGARARRLCAAARRATTPTTSTPSPLMFTRLPSGSAIREPAAHRRLVDDRDARASAVSRSVNRRPRAGGRRRPGSSRAWRWPWRSPWLTFGGGGGAPSTAKPTMAPRPLSGSTLVAPTAVTPGKRPQARLESRRRDARSLVVRRRPRPAATGETTAPVRRRNPGSTRVNWTKLRISSPAPISSTTASAISATTSAARMRWPPPLGRCRARSRAARSRRRVPLSPAAPAASPKTRAREQRSPKRERRPPRH